MLFKSIWTSLILQLFTLLVILQLYFEWNIDIISYLFLLALFLFYKIVITFLSINEKANENFSISRLYIIMIIIEIVYFVLPKKNVPFYFFPNDSIFSILFAAQLIFVTPYLKKYNENFVKNKILARLFPICYILLSYCFLFYTKGRGGILGFTIAICILNFSYLKLKIGYFRGIIIFSGLLLLLLTYKSNSSGGRLLIYKVITTQLEPKELITGIGYGKFMVKYNDLQAKYFSKKSIDSKEALLANNTHYMFNDPLQLIIETGLIGLIILCILSLKLFLLFRGNHNLS